MLRDIGQHDDIEAASQVAALEVGVANADGSEPEILEDPTRPTFVDGGGPWAVESDTRLRYWKAAG